MEEVKAGKAQMRRWRADVVAWAEENLWVQRPDTGRVQPLRLEPGQKEWLREATRKGDGAPHPPAPLSLREEGGKAKARTRQVASLREGQGELVYKVVAASWPKREGKSELVAILVAHRTFCFANQRSMILANSERQAASVIFDAIVGFLANSPGLQGFVSEDEVGTRRLRVPAFGNEIICMPCNPATVQGIQVTGILAADEVHALSEAGLKAFNYLVGQTEMAGSQVAISSQAGAPVDSNPMWRLYQARNEPHIFFDYRTEHSTSWGKAVAAKQKALLTPAEYDHLHANAWVGLGQKLFALSLVERAEEEFTEPRTREQLEVQIRKWGFQGWSWTAGIGLDRAGVSVTGDRSVLSVVLKFTAPHPPAPLSSIAASELAAPQEEGGTANGGDVYKLIRCKVCLTGEEAEILAEIKAVEAMLGRNAAKLFERYACEDLVSKVRGAELANPSGPKQTQMFTALFQTLSEGRFGFAQGAGVSPTGTVGLLRAELLNFGYGVAGGSMKWGTQSGHDDTVYSLAWGKEAADLGMAAWVATADQFVFAQGPELAVYA